MKTIKKQETTKGSRSHEKVLNEGDLFEKMTENFEVAPKGTLKKMLKLSTQTPDGRIIVGRDVDENGNLLPKK